MEPLKVVVYGNGGTEKLGLATVSRLPCVGEAIVVDGDTLFREVFRVYHNIQSSSGTIGHVYVRDFS